MVAADTGAFQAHAEQLRALFGPHVLSLGRLAVLQTLEYGHDSDPCQSQCVTSVRSGYKGQPWPAVCCDQNLLAGCVGTGPIQIAAAFGS